MKKILNLDKGGFSIIELVVAIFLLGIFYSITLGTGWEPGVLDLHKEARHLVTDLRWARNRAIMSGSNHFVHLDFGKDFYWISKGEESEEEILRERQLVEGVFLKDFSLQGNGFHFSPTGAPSRGNTITLKGEGSLAHIITRVGTGRIRMKIEKKGD